MKPTRPIIVKSPCLRKLRKNLRQLLNAVTDDRHFELLNHSRETEWVTPISGKRPPRLKLYEKAEELHHAACRSILTCSRPGCQDSIDGDRIYVPGLNQWFCLDCHELMVKYHPFFTGEEDGEGDYPFFTGEEEEKMRRRREEDEKEEAFFYRKSRF